MNEIQNQFSRCEVHGHFMATHQIIGLLISKRKLELSDIDEIEQIHAAYEARKGVK